MASFRQKPFQLKTFSSSTEKLFDFHCIAPKNQLKICVNNFLHQTQNHNKSFRLLPKVNPPGTYTALVKKCKVKSFKKQRALNGEFLLRKHHLFRSFLISPHLQLAGTEVGKKVWQDCKIVKKRLFPADYLQVTKELT